VELFNLSKAKKKKKRLLVEVMKQIHDDHLVGSSLIHYSWIKERRGARGPKVIIDLRFFIFLSSIYDNQI
jgi:hypothetical protein